MIQIYLQSIHASTELDVLSNLEKITYKDILGVSLTSDRNKPGFVCQGRGKYSSCHHRLYKIYACHTTRCKAIIFPQPAKIFYITSARRRDYCTSSWILIWSQVKIYILMFLCSEWFCCNYCVIYFESLNFKIRYAHIFDTSLSRTNAMGAIISAWFLERLISLIFVLSTELFSRSAA